MSLNLPHRRRSSGAPRHAGPAHRSARKGEQSEGAPGEAEPLRPQSSTELPDGPEIGQALQAQLGSTARAPSRSSLKMSRQVWLGALPCA